MTITTTTTTTAVAASTVSPTGSLSPQSAWSRLTPRAMTTSSWPTSPTGSDPGSSGQSGWASCHPNVILLSSFCNNTETLL